MKKEELYETLEGIDAKFITEADMIKVKKKPSVWIKRMVAAACLCLCLGCTVPVLAAVGNDYAYKLLYLVSPAAAQKLKPVNVSCEDNGIEMTVAAADVEGDTTNILVSFRDITGNRLDETTDIFDSFSIHTPYDQSGSGSFVSYDAETKTAIFMITIAQMEHVLIPGDKITFSVGQLLSKKEHSNFRLTQIDTGKVLQITEFEENPTVRGGNGKDYNAVKGSGSMLMKPDEENAVSLKKGVALTGYGIANGKLHIQLRFDDIRNTDNHGYVYLKNREGDIIEGETDVAFWDESRVNSFEEYFFPIGAEELADYEIWGEFWTCNGGPVKGNWQVTFPLSGN